MRPYLFVEWNVIEINKTTSKELTNKRFKCANIIPLFKTINNDPTTITKKRFAISRFDENNVFFSFNHHHPVTGHEN